jgi:hypothetical protein
MKTFSFPYLRQSASICGQFRIPQFRIRLQLAAPGFRRLFAENGRQSHPGTAKHAGWESARHRRVREDYKSRIIL